MPPATRLARPSPLACCLLVLASAAGAAAQPDADKFDEYEQDLVERCADRLARVENTDHAKWLRVLRKTYADGVTEPTREEEYAAWFDLLGGGGDEWRRVGSPNSEIAALFDKVADSRRLGPVPAITREEFMRYADRVLDRGNRRAVRGVRDSSAEADRAFRVLDRDGDGILSSNQLTTGLRDAGLKADTDANGRIDKDEYRAYFAARVEDGIDAALARAEEKDRRDDDDKPAPKPKSDDADDELPEWFPAVDADEDGQIALHEWRKAGGAIDYFLEMDLNEDGLLTEEEYRRFAEMTKDDDPDQ
jgi:Ca2+-binding EF-hand superfamily protein